MSENNHGLDGIQAPKLDDDFYAPPVKQPQNSADKLSGIAAPTLDDGGYTAPVKPKQPERELPKVSAAILEDNPAPQQQYKPVFTNPDLENAKKEALNRSIKSAIEEKPDDFDQEKSRQIYRDLLRVRESEMAEKGAKLVIIIMIVGIIAGAALFVFGSTVSSVGTTEFFQDVGGAASYYSLVLILLAILSIFRIEKLKSFASFLFGLTVLLLIIGALIILPNLQEKVLIAVACLVVSLAGSVVTCYFLSGNECIRKYYARKEQEW